MLENILKEEDHAFVFFYEEHDTDAFTILDELESIDEKLDKQDLTMVKISDTGAIDAFGIRDMPALVYFEGKFLAFPERAKILSLATQEHFILKYDRSCG